MDAMHTAQMKMARRMTTGRIARDGHPVTGCFTRLIPRPRVTDKTRCLRRLGAGRHLESLTSGNVLPLGDVETEERKPLHRLKGVSFGGSGIFFWWEIGCVLWLLEHVDVDTCPLFGASGGALAATLCACKVDPFVAFDVANRISEENNVFERPLGVAGIWGKLIRQWLDELLPDDAAEICRDRVVIVVTTLPSLKLEAISDFESREALIDANMASAHIPFFLDGKLSSRFKDWNCVDGSLHDFFAGCNSDVLTCNGSTLNIDYFDVASHQFLHFENDVQDARLDRKRFDFVALKKPAEVINMIHLGYQYIDRLSETEAFQRALLPSNDRHWMPDINPSSVF